MGRAIDGKSKEHSSKSNYQKKRKAGLHFVYGNPIRINKARKMQKT